MTCDIDKLIAIVQSNYAFGAFTGDARIIRNDARTLAALLSFSGGEVFVKRMKQFDVGLAQGLQLQHILYGRGYPACRLLFALDGLWIEDDGSVVAVFEPVDNARDGVWPKLDVEQTTCYAAALAQFHRLTVGMELQAAPLTRISRLTAILERWTAQTTGQTRQRVDDMLTLLRAIRCNAGRKCGSFPEFNPGHAVFQRDGSLRIIDWEVGWDYPLYDIGGAATCCFDMQTGALDFDLLRAFLHGYASQRELTDPERCQLPDALAFGCVQYALWAMADQQTDGVASPQHWSADDIARLDWIRGVGLQGLRSLLDDITPSSSS